MTFITPEEVSKTLYLARLKKTANELDLKHYQKELEYILSYVNELATVVKPSTQIRRSKNISSLRQDTAREDSAKEQEIRARIIELFPIKQSDLLILPGVLE